MEKLSERFSDPESSVRDALHKLLSQHLLPKLGNGKLVPFLPLLMAHISGAMTHSDEKTRSESLEEMSDPESRSNSFAGQHSHSHEFVSQSCS